MPFALALSHTPPRTFAAASGGWRRILAIADAAVARFEALWHGLFVDLRLTLRERPLAADLAGPNILAAQMRMTQQWEQTVAIRARRLVPAVGAEVVDEAGMAMMPAVERLAGTAFSYTAGWPEADQWIQQYTGTQIRGMTQTTLKTVQGVLREGWQAGTHPRTLARQLRQVIGLTPRQQGALETLRARLTAQGRSARAIQREIDLATARGLQARALNVARTESLAFANYGTYHATEQAVKRGYMDGQRVRRQWLLTPGACAAICLPIPGMNPDGVGLTESFQTPAGDLFLPPGHPACRCATTISLLP